MPLKTYSAAEAFLSDVQATLEVREAENSLLLGIALDSAASSPSERSLAAEIEGDILLLAAMANPPYPLVLYASPDAHETAYHQLVGGLAGLPISGVVSTREAAERFSTIWCTAAEAEVCSTISQRIYELEAVAHPSHPASGMLRVATDTDVKLVSRWFVEFHKEALNEHDTARADDLARKRIAQGDIFLWDSDGPKCMVGRSRPTRHTISINAVYTPPEHRRQGLATSTVAELCGRLLAEGFQRCVLYTDLSNPTSNSIYQRIGFKPVCDSLHIQFGHV